VIDCVDLEKPRGSEARQKTVRLVDKQQVVLVRLEFEKWKIVAEFGGVQVDVLRQKRKRKKMALNCELRLNC
jgi:hypothetical protein